LPTYYVVEALVYRNATVIASDISDDYPFTITVPTQSSSVLKVLSPNGGESLVSGTTQRITWSSDLDSDSLLDIYLMNNADNAILIKSGIAPKPEFFDWNILDKFLSYSYPFYKIVIVQRDRHIKDYSDNYFTISVPSSNCTIDVPPAPGYVTDCINNGGTMSNSTTDENGCVLPSTCIPKPKSVFCDTVSKSIVDSVGGCNSIDQTKYSNIYQACCTKITKEKLLSMLDSYLDDGVIGDTEKTALLTALDSYLGQ